MLLPAAGEVVEGVLVTRDGDGDAVDFCCLLSSCFFSSAWASLEPASTSLVTLPTQYFCYEKHRPPPLWSPCPHNISVMKKHRPPPLWSPCPHNISVMKNTGLRLFGHPAHTIFLWWKTQASASLVTLPTQYFCYEKHRPPPLWSPCPHNTFVMKNTSIYLFGHPAYTFLLWPTPVSTSLVTLTIHFCYGKHWCPPLWSTCPHKSSVMENTSVHLLGHPAHTTFLLPYPHSILVMENTGVHLFHHPAHTFLLPCPHISVMENTGVHLFGQTAHTKYLLWKNTGVHLFDHPAHTSFLLSPFLTGWMFVRPNILQQTMIRFLIELLVRRIWFGQSKLYFILNWLVMRCKLRPELAADTQQTAWSKM